MSETTPVATPVAAEVAAPAAVVEAAAPAVAAEPVAAAASTESAAEPAAAAASSADDEKVEGADSTAEYQAVVALKPVEVSTGEEQDEVLYKQRAACYRFDSDSTSWKERGRGDVKLLQNKESKSIRVLLRQEKTLKLCMNHKVHPELELVANTGSDRSWTWRTVDYSTDEGEKQTFALRFKDADTANAFKTKYDECRALNAETDKGRSTGSAAASPEKAEKPAETV